MTTPKPFSSRTYHTIKDMISSRFSKSKTDQFPETGLNNSDSNETPKGINHSLSPHSQLVQRGVYLANSQPCNRNTTTTNVYSNNGIDIAKRNQEVREQIMGQYRERAVDVGHTAGISQQTVGNVTPMDGVTNGRHTYEVSHRPMPTPKHSVLDGETPHRYRDHQVTKNVKRCQNENDGIIRRNDECEPTAGKKTLCYSSLSTYYFIWR